MVDQTLNIFQLIAGIGAVCLLCVLVLVLIKAFTPDIDAKIEDMTKAHMESAPRMPPLADRDHDVVVFCASLMAVILAVLSLAEPAMPGDGSMVFVVYVLLFAILAGLLIEWWRRRKPRHIIHPDLCGVGFSRRVIKDEPYGRGRDKQIDKLDWKS